MYFNPYNGYQPNNQFQQFGQQIVKVNGENGARAYQMPPNASALLLDESAPIVWLKQTDGAGYPTVTPYKIEPYTKPTEPDYNSILARIERLEGMINDKSYSTAIEPEARKQPAGTYSNGKRQSAGDV